MRLVPGWRHADRDQLGPAFAFGEIKLPPGSSVRVEAGAMAMTAATWR